MNHPNWGSSVQPKKSIHDSLTHDLGELDGVVVATSDAVEVDVTWSSGGNVGEVGVVGVGGVVGLADDAGVELAVDETGLEW